ncbi:MAG: potassium-transporting ATPase subunit KdpB [Rickettsiales bacterium]
MINTIDKKIDLKACCLTSFKRLNPLQQLRNPVMFTVFVCAVITSAHIFIGPAEDFIFAIIISFLLWLTIFCANFAESIAEMRSKAHVDTLEMTKDNLFAKRLKSAQDIAVYDSVNAKDLRKGDLIIVSAGEVIPSDGQIIKGIGSIDESAITGESAPVIREAGSDRDGVTGGTTLLSNWLVVEITADPGNSFLDNMIKLTTSAKRQKNPNEIALGILLAAMTIVFVLVCASFLPFSSFISDLLGEPHEVNILMLISLLVCLAPTTIGGLLSAIGISGILNLLKINVIAMSGRAVEAAGDITILLLDKTGTITEGNRCAVEILPATGVEIAELAQAVRMASEADTTSEGRSIVKLVDEKYKAHLVAQPLKMTKLIPFSAETRCSGIEFDGSFIVKGAGDAIYKKIKSMGGSVPAQVEETVNNIARTGGTPLVVAKDARILGVVHLKDILKIGIKEKLAQLKAMGIKSVMITGDNILTANYIASEAGIDSCIASATPNDKLKFIKDKQEAGEMIAMVGDGTNDVPALAQANVAMVMNSGTQAAKEAGNMIDLDSDPTKLVEIIKVSKQILMTRGALTTFSISNDVAKYFAIMPALLISYYPSNSFLNIMDLTSAKSAVLSALIFNTLIIPALIPLAIKGIAYRPNTASHLLMRNIFIYGFGGVIIPFICIKLIDVLLTVLGVTAHV